MSIERAPDAATGVSLFAALTAQFASDPLGALASIAAIVASVFAIVNYIRMWVKRR